MKRAAQFYLLTYALLFAKTLCAAVKLAGVFGDHMVLQRGQPVPVWGTAAPGEKVSVAFADKRFETVAGPDGMWRVNLPPLAASKEGGTLMANGVAVTDVLVGEVWFLSGQSNMALPLTGPNTRFRDCAGGTLAQITHRPAVRYVQGPTHACELPRTEPIQPVEWRPFTPEHLLKAPPSAVGFYFGCALEESLDMPVGLVCVAAAGTNIDAWTPREGSSSRPDLKDMAEWKYVPVPGWKKEGTYKLPINSHMQQPGVLWNGTVHPFAPLAMRGLLWYQGERNASAGPEETARYRSKLHALYNGWAGAFANSAMKLNVVQLCSWGRDIAVFQEEQARFVEENQNAGLVIINDLGNLNDIHPNRKALVGVRLALLALKRDYGFGHLRAESPKPSELHSDGDVLSFRVVHAERLYYYNPDKSACTGFEIAGDDGMFFPATIINAENDPAKLNFGEIRGTEICLRSREVSAPVKVRYLHSRPWYGCVHNEADLPMGAFHLGY